MKMKLQIKGKRKNHDWFIGFVHEFCGFGFLISVEKHYTDKRWTAIELNLFWLRMWYTIDL